MAWSEENKVLQVLEQYRHAVHTQEAADFLPLWAEDGENVLISPAGCFLGTQSIYEDFLLERIRKAYTKIDLISKEVAVRKLTDTVAVVLFSYYTDCIRRESGEPFGLEGLETQVLRKEGECWKLAHIHYSGKAMG